MPWQNPTPESVTREPEARQLGIFDPLGLDAMGGRVLGQQDTSQLAALLGNHRVAGDRRRVLAHVARCDALGATQDEVSAALDMLHQTASARFKELRDADYIARTGGRRLTRTGSPAHVHRVTDRGHAVLAYLAQRNAI